MLRRTFLAVPFATNALDACLVERRPRQVPYWILRDTPVPANLLELFNGNCKEQARYYTERDHLQELADVVVGGVHACREYHSDLRRVFVEPGHGMNVPGMTAANGRTETNFVKRIHVMVARTLFDQGISVSYMRYEQPEGWLQRENRKQLERRTKAIGDMEKLELVTYGLSASQGLHLSFHVDSAVDTRTGQPKLITDPREPRVYVHPHGSQLSKDYADIMQAHLNAYAAQMRGEFCR